MPNDFLNFGGGNISWISIGRPFLSIGIILPSRSSFMPLKPMEFHDFCFFVTCCLWKSLPFSSHSTIFNFTWKYKRLKNCVFDDVVVSLFSLVPIGHVGRIFSHDFTLSLLIHRPALAWPFARARVEGRSVSRTTSGGRAGDPAHHKCFPKVPLAFVKCWL